MHARLRENAEPVAFYGGIAKEGVGVLDRFSKLMRHRLRVLRNQLRHSVVQVQPHVSLNRHLRSPGALWGKQSVLLISTMLHCICSSPVQMFHPHSHFLLLTAGLLPQVPGQHVGSGADHWALLRGPPAAGGQRAGPRRHAVRHALPHLRHHQPVQVQPHEHAAGPLRCKPSM